MMKRLLLALLILALPMAALAEAVPTQAPATETPATQTSATETPATDAPTKWLLTVNFLYEDGTEAEKSQQLQLAAGEAYEIDLPKIDGFEPDPKKVEGAMPEADLEIDVIYCVAAEETASPEATPSVDATATPGANVSPDETPVPEETPAPEGLTLTIHYVMGASAGSGRPGNSENQDEAEDSGQSGMAQGTSVAADYVLTGLKEGDAYDVESPQAEGLTPDQQRVSGVMGAENVEITVTYTMGSSFPGGGFPGGGMGGFGGMSGMAGMEGEMGGLKVTPGEALTDIHTSGDCTMTLYGTVVLTGDTAAPLATAEGEALAISLLLNDENVAYAAEIEEDTLILTGEAGKWQVGGDALRALAESGIARLVLVTGDAAAWMPTEGFASGYAWNQLQMQGMPSSQFVYALDAGEQLMQLDVADATYSAEDIAAAVQFGAADAWRQD